MKMDQGTSANASPLSGHPGTEPQYTLKDIVGCMRISAAMLACAEGGNDPNYSGQAKLLRAAANDLELRIGELP